MERLVILARHGRSVANAARMAGSPESRIQGAGLDVPLDSLGEWQSRAFGMALGKFVAHHSLTIDAVHSSDALRAVETRNLALSTGHLELPLYPPDSRLRELCKGEWEGKLSSEVTIDPQQSRNWHFRYGGKEKGGETAFEAGSRWLHWLHDAARQEIAHSAAPSTILAFGHNGVTAYGLWLLTHPNQEPCSFEATEHYRTDNGTAVLLAQDDEGWHVLSERIAPSPIDYDLTREPNDA